MALRDGWQTSVRPTSWLITHVDQGTLCDFVKIAKPEIFWIRERKPKEIVPMGGRFPLMCAAYRAVGLFG